MKIGYLMRVVYRDTKIDSQLERATFKQKSTGRNMS